MAVITIEKEYKEILMMDKVKFREGICMTVLNMKLNVGYINIDINIGKRMKSRKDICLESIRYQKEINESLEKTKALSQDLIKLNIY